MRLVVCSLLGLLCVTAWGDEHATNDESEVLFARRVASLLREKCVGCHGQDPEVIEGNLDLRGIESLAIGGDSGEPGIVPGDPEGSSIYLAAARGDESFSAMPPKESEALTDEQLVWLRRWIETGAKWPSDQRIAEIKEQYESTWSVEDGVTVKTSGGLDDNWTSRRYDPAGLWAYQPLDRSVIRSASRRTVDDFIDEKHPDGLTIARRADRPTLIRRATFDLTGLPPTPEEVAAFINDPADDATAMSSLVERLLASPHYGERMAQHWLDVTRYADSSGFANDFERGNAWRYRDYVIRAFNEDKPYDEFVRQQIAGDEITPNDPEAIVATGFLRMGPWELTGMEVAKVARGRFLDDVTNSVGETFLGQSLQCCRCHDHKFDPIPTRDYYRVQAVFATTQLSERAAKFLTEENVSGFEESKYLKQLGEQHRQVLADLDEVLLANANEWFDRVASVGPETPDSTSSVDENRRRWNEAVAQAGEGDQSGERFDKARNLLRREGVPDHEYPPKAVGFTPEQFGRERVARKGLQRLQWELDRYRPFALAVYNGRTPQMTSVASPLRVPKDVTKGELEESCIRTGGDPFAQGEPVTPGVLSVISDQVDAAVPETINGRRTALANWIAHPNNPLTTRVIANRLWQWHFGRAIAGNPNNFGSTGKRPTHPKLLDWLAYQVVVGDWSLKRLHRLIMNSDAYCRDTRHPHPELLRELDPSGDSYAVFLPRRLSAEELRDSMLAVSGELNPTLGGIPCRPVINLEVALQPRQVMGTFAAAWTPNPEPSQRNRRSIYVLKLRGLVDPSLEVFNSPSPDFSCERRDTSTVTPQVFAMFNSTNMLVRSLSLASVAMQENQEPDEVIRWLYQRLFSRAATDDEVRGCVEHWKRVGVMLPPEPVPIEPLPHEVVREAVEENTGETFTFVECLNAMDDFVADVQPSDVDRVTQALADVCLVLLNSNEFVYVY